MVETPERLNLKVLMALLDTLGCSMDDVIDPVAAGRPRANKAADGTGTTGVGDFRPKRARIVRPS